jgi:four helix bundle protein
MALDPGRLDAHAVALELLVLASRVIERIPGPQGPLADQLTRASTSVVLKLAEGAGKRSKADRRACLVAVREAGTDLVALLGVARRLGLVEEAELRAGKRLIVRAASILASPMTRAR